MSKVICDVCGTTYPETADRCPICGSARTDASNTAAGADGAEQTVAYTYVKGGRFSKANVRKRNRNAELEERTVYQRKSDAENPEKEKKNGVLILILVLMIAIVLVIAFLLIRYILPGKPVNPTAPSNAATGEPLAPTETQKPTSAPTSAPTEAPTETTEPSRPCTEIKLSESVIELQAEGRGWLLNVETDPADTTDSVAFASSDPSVATVTDQGRVTAVGPGQAVISVTCGDVQATCRVICSFEVETEPTEAPTDETGSDPTEATEDQGDHLFYDMPYSDNDITLMERGETYTFNTGTISRSAIIWTILDTDVATVENGQVTAVGPGMTTLVAEYAGIRETCVIRCNFED